MSAIEERVNKALSEFGLSNDTISSSGSSKNYGKNNSVLENTNNSIRQNVIEKQNETIIQLLTEIRDILCKRNT